MKGSTILQDVMTPLERTNFIQDYENYLINREGHPDVLPLPDYLEQDFEDVREFLKDSFIFRTAIRDRFYWVSVGALHDGDAMNNIDGALRLLIKSKKPTSETRESVIGEVYKTASESMKESSFLDGSREDHDRYADGFIDLYRAITRLTDEEIYNQVLSSEM